ncbi:hypothetical protein V490_00291 [Pseudogymnoascus sp. VKM F-3557]|nr:hypothetical protein V490_00291 [Pseudogymnoascus sp. VKM F-3557]
MGSKRKRDSEEEPASDTARKPKSPPKSPSEAKALPSKQSLDDESKRLRNQLMQIQTGYIAYFGQRLQAGETYRVYRKAEIKRGEGAWAHEHVGCGGNGFA